MYQIQIYEKRKLNRKKVAICILFIAIIALSIFSAIRVADYYKAEAFEKNLMAQVEVVKQEKEIAKKQEEEQKKQQRQAEKLTPEQMQAIESIYHSEQKRVFLTFDDGPSESVTPLILDVLKQEEVKATFFVLGNRAKANPAILKRMYQEGHYIANHGYSHVYSQVYTSPQTVLEEYQYTDQCIKEALENPNYHSKVFRFPGGSSGGYYSEIKNQAKQVLKENGISYLDWNCLSQDAAGAKTKEQLVQNVITTAGTKNSIVVLMHDAGNKILTYETLPEIIHYFRDNGYTFMNLYDMIEIQ